MSENRTECVTSVYYRPQDYVGFKRRLFIDAVDVITATVVSSIIAVVTLAIMSALNRPESEAGLVFGAAWVGTWVSYFVPFKRYRRTLGYRLGRARIVDYEGRCPGFRSLLIRFCVATFPPGGILLDLLWTTGDECRQALHDKLAGTYVVLERAEPVGRERVIWSWYHILGATFVFGEVPPRCLSGQPQLR